MVSSQIPPPPPNPLPSRTATLAPPHPVPVCSNTRTWISTSTSLWASWARMRVRRVQLTMKSSFPRLHIFSSSPLATLLRHARPPRRTYARFVVPERNNADADPSTRLDHARASPDQGLDFDLTSHPSVRQCERRMGRLAHAARSRWFERQPQQGRRIRKLARCSSCGPLPRDGRRLSYGWRGKGRRDGLVVWGERERR